MIRTVAQESVALSRIKALAHDIRYEIVRMLADGERCVCDLEVQLELPQSKVSYHLGILREVGIVVSESRGKNSYYRLVDEVLYTLGGEVLRDVFTAARSGLYQNKSVC
ncbi:ArsR/SmtB family transcription factor [Deinococcus peraridilitoris]|uniref:Putative transcriptional regulator n=1 Tax=Deinococcus peraridilitoris (strain DSM 19664 / LMG 22246 / CIP 109416 / KR-200) TaxID=937777 RepID=L0A5X3_DEIPD|nr:metalloregulator ArsR/SmtB family transcription factor [Deinococcus peraridilitoris]AFZ68844.1 putative transcriptional regulator [Deinococcus peraridilitoris DSM 19664]